MEEESISWVLRTRFSHTMFQIQRSNSTRETCSSVSTQSNRNPESKLKSLSLDSKPRKLNFVGLSVPVPRQSNRESQSSKLDVPGSEISNSKKPKDLSSEMKPQGSSLDYSLRPNLLFTQSDRNLGSKTKELNVGSSSSRSTFQPNCDSAGARRHRSPRNWILLLPCLFMLMEVQD